MKIKKNISKTFKFDNVKIKMKVTTAFITEYEYSEKGSKSYTVEENGSESWMEFDEHGNPLVDNIDNGQKILYQYEYNDEGKIIHSTHQQYSKYGFQESEGENFYKYDKAGNLICKYEKLGRIEKIEEYEYDSSGKLKRHTYFTPAL